MRHFWYTSLLILGSSSDEHPINQLPMSLYSSFFTISPYVVTEEHPTVVKCFKSAHMMFQLCRRFTVLMSAHEVTSLSIPKPAPLRANLISRILSC
ncbi:hypothetical protein BDQ12DRAFT_271632 [Crucibulum laeve]|uniref:Uncharacterized protein n=1 Tax=Crucibulum laeve TaxID=68775 RepID=A0A5C3MAM7_9AGAR|nr:hypothetical protein BDQ12DRAFT_271632 [Crucibulum laeve]